MAEKELSLRCGSCRHILRLFALKVWLMAEEHFLDTRPVQAFLGNIWIQTMKNMPEEDFIFRCVT